MAYIKVSVFQVSRGKGRKTTTWSVGFTHPTTGERVRKSLGTANEDLARLKAREIERRLNLEPLGLYDPVEQYKGLTLAAAIQEFLETHCAKLRPDSRDTYARCLRKFANEMGDV